jgi:excisionase family DNA binding protein
MPDTVPQLLTLLAVAKLLSVSPHTVRAFVRKGKLHPVRICRRLLFTPDELKRFVELNSSYNRNAAPIGATGESGGARC